MAIRVENVTARRRMTAIVAGAWLQRASPPRLRTEQRRERRLTVPTLTVRRPPLPPHLDLNAPGARKAPPIPE